MKSLITRVLLATDFSPCAARALEYALAVTSSWKAELHVLHVLEFYPGMDPEYPVNQMYLDELRKDADRQFIDVGIAQVNGARAHQVARTAIAQSSFAACWYPSISPNVL